MLDSCAERGSVSDIELVPIQPINGAYARMLRSDVKYRFDMASLRASREDERYRRGCARDDGDRQSARHRTPRSRSSGRAAR